jgi:hypothetical protein
MIERLAGVRYVVPLPEGGSLPAVVETDRDGPYVVKFRGAGQGAKALIAETLAAGLALALSLPVPRPAIVRLADGFGRGEPDPEIQDILRGSAGENFGLAYLPGALAFDPAVDRDVDKDLAAAIVWFDAFITNVDRTPKNPNLLSWHKDLWLIDHGASLYFHHAWDDYLERSQSRFPAIKDHVLLPWASALPEAEASLRQRVTADVIRRVVECVPEAWLGAGAEPRFSTATEHREAYVTYLLKRLEATSAFIEEAQRARAQLV